MALRWRSPGTPVGRGQSVRAASASLGRSSNRAAIQAVAFLFLALLGVLIALFFYIDAVPRVHVLALGVSEYSDPRLPPCPWVENDCKQLLSLRWETKNSFTRQERNLLAGELRELEKKSDLSVVVYIAGHAAVSDEGVVCLLPADAQLRSPEKWLPLRELLASLGRCKAKHRLLVLDLCTPFTDPRLGRLTDDLAARMQPDLDAAMAEDPQLTILTACSPGQVSLVSEDLGQSVFMHYLVRGLRGEADHHGTTGKKDDRVWSRELATYVTLQVDRWATGNRQARQTPRLLGDGDFPLVLAQAAAAEPVEAGEMEAYPDWLLPGWQLRDKWLAEAGAAAALPVARNLETVMLRAEQSWRGGEPADELRQPLKRQIERLESRRGSKIAPARVGPPQSLAEAATRGLLVAGKVDPDAAHTLDALTRLDTRLRQAKPDDKEAMKDRERLLADRAQLLKKHEGKPLELARLVLADAQHTQEPGPAAVRFWSELLAPLLEIRELAEVRYLRRLAEQAADEKDWPADAVEVALQVSAEAARAETVEPRVEPWVRVARAAAGQTRDDAQRILVGTDRPGRARAVAPFRLARDDLKLVNETAAIASAAFRARDNAAAFLPGHVAYLEVHDGEEQTWRDAVRELQDLEQSLAGPLPESDRPPRALIDKLKLLTKKLTAKVETLQKPYAPAQAKSAIDQGRGQPANWRGFNALLASPWPSAADRALLWKAQRTVSAFLLKETQGAEPAAGSTPQAWADTHRDPAIRDERQRGLRRARWSIDLLGPQGSPALKPVEEAYAQVNREPQDQPRWQSLAQALRRAWDTKSRASEENDK